MIMIGGIVIISAALYAVGRGLVSVIGRARSGVGVAWRYGLANVSRRGRDSAVQVVAFGLGITVLLLLTLVRTDLLEGWRATLDDVELEGAVAPSDMARAHLEPLRSP